MDNNFDEKIASDADSSGNNYQTQNSQDSEQRQTLRDLQDTVTDSSAAAVPTINGDAADRENIPLPNAQEIRNEQSVQNVQNVQHSQQFGQFGQYQPQTQFQQQGQNFGSVPQYIPPQGYDGNFAGQPGQFGQPMQQPQPMQNGFPPAGQTSRPQNKKRFSGGCFWSLISAIVLLFAAVVILAVKIVDSASDQAPDSSDNVGRFDNLAETQKAEHMVVNIPAADKPKLDDEFYQDKETGLLTSVGVARTILPSQVMIKVFDDIPYAPVSSGSGVILTSDGYILTNAHVVDGAKRLSVGFYGDGESEAVIVGIDKKSDLAVVKVDKTGLSPAQIGKSSSLEIGEEVALAGAGGGFENTVTYGHVTGLGREIDTDYISSSTIRCIQSDAALNPGNSGGALVNMYGQVVGIPVALMNHETYENIGFCIAIDDAVPIAEDLIAQGYVSSRTRVGITYMSIGDAAASGYGIPAGLCVMEIDPYSGAAFAGLKPYDIITRIDGERVFGASEISEILADKVPGDVITISVFRKEITGEIDFFDAELELIADTSSVSGYNINNEDEDFFSRDVIK